MENSMNNLTVFLVEPSSTQSNVIQSRLKEAGVQFVQRFTDGNSALSAMRAHPPAIAISAMHLGDMTGADLAVAIRTDDALKEVAFILVTSTEDPKLLDLVRQAGACAILPKPFSLAELRLALSNAVNYLDLGQLNVADEIDHVRVLIVDDSRSARIFLRHALETMGFANILEAASGLQAQSVLQETQVDLVFTDFNMPEMDGLQLLQFIREKSWQSEVPVILISSEKHPDRLAAVRQAGVSGICDKPFELAALKSLVENILNQPAH